MTKGRLETRWSVEKDFYRDGQHFTCGYGILYGSEAEAEAKKSELEAGADQSFFGLNDEDDAFLFVDQIEIRI